MEGKQGFPKKTRRATSEGQEHQEPPCTVYVLAFEETTSQQPSSDCLK